MSGDPLQPDKTGGKRKQFLPEIKAKERWRRGREDKWPTCWCCRDQQRAFRIAQVSAEKLEHAGPDEKKRVT